MSFEWKNYKIGELTSWYSGGTPSKSRQDYWDGDIAWISAKTFKNSRISDSEVKITQLGLENGSRIAPKDSILLLVRGSGLFNDIPIGIVEKPVAFNQDIKALKVNEEVIDVYFFLYWLIGNKDLLRTKLEETGIGAGKFDTEIIKSLELSLPPMNIQRRIADIFKVIDDKIELNRQMNATLEAMAQTLFKKWFVLPINDGVLPNGWKEDGISNLCYVQNGYAFKSQDFKDKGDIGIIKIKNINGNIVDINNTQFVDIDIVVKLDKKFSIKEGDILIAMTGAEVGKIGLVPFCGKEFWLNQRVGKFVEIKEFSSYYLYLLLVQEEYQSVISNSASGSAQPNISSSTIENLRIIIPTEGIIYDFGVLVKPMFDSILQNIHEMEVLRCLRDNLLPKLINGEIII